MASRVQQDVTLSIVTSSSPLTFDFQEVMLVVGPPLNVIGGTRDAQEVVLAVATSPPSVGRQGQLWVIT